MSNNARVPFEKAQSPAVFCAILIFLLIAYGAWLTAFWPGLLGQDSFAILREVENPEISAGKTFFWYYFVRFFYQLGHFVEAPIVAALIFCAAIFARILCWSWCQGFKKSTFFLLLFIGFVAQTSPIALVTSAHE